MNKIDRIPTPGNIFMFQALLWIGIDGIVKKEMFMEKWGYIYFYDTGDTAVYGGFLLIFVGLIIIYFYFKNIKLEVIKLLKSKDILNSVYFIWVLFIFSPFFSYELNLPRYFRIISIGLIGIVNLVLSTKYHLKIKNMILS